MRRVPRSHLLGFLLLLASAVATGCARSDEPVEPAPVRTLPEAAGPLVLDVSDGDSLAMAPDFELPRLGGGTLRLRDYRGRVVLLNFWATWCPPCRAEIPDLVALQAALEDEGLTTIGVSLDEGGFKAVRPFAASHEINYPLVVDDGAVAAAFGSLYGLPTTLVIDKRGRIVRRVIGLFPVEEMRPVLEELLAEGY